MVSTISRIGTRRSGSAPTSQVLRLPVSGPVETAVIPAAETDDEEDEDETDGEDAADDKDEVDGDEVTAFEVDEDERSVRDTM
ncbi:MULTISPECIES: hypothetical protein [Frankia]|uniref:hypothetical protein n=1 Tax=Frankia TaxID=1854 RepID=UPI00138EE5D5|nr:MULTISPECIES: hypothetical protein [Frankia]